MAEALKEVAQAPDPSSNLAAVDFKNLVYSNCTVCNCVA